MQTSASCYSDRSSTELVIEPLVPSRVSAVCRRARTYESAEQVERVERGLELIRDEPEVGPASPLLPLDETCLEKDRSGVG